MNKDICQKCNRKLIFWDSEGCFYCLGKINKNYRKFLSCDPNIYYLSKSKWKKFNSFENIFSKDKSEYINNCLKKIKTCHVIYFDCFSCPYSFEHQISDWNDK